MRAERRRQDDAAQDDGRARRARRRRDPQAVGADRRLPAAGRPDPHRPHRLRRSVAAPSSALLDDASRDARRSRSGSATTSIPEAEHEAMLRALQRSAGSLPPARRLQHRAEDRRRCCSGLGFATADFDTADRDVLRRLADAHRARQAAARPARTCCCSTSRPTISISKRATGSRSTSQRYPHAVILVSHDRFFLDAVVTRIADLDAAHADRLRRQLQRLPRRARRADRALRKAEARAGRRGRARARCSSTGSATRRPRRRRCRAGSRCSRRSCRSRCRPSASGSTSLSRLREERPHGARAEARAQGVRRRASCSTTSTCTSSAAIASRSSARTAPASRR